MSNLFSLLNLGANALFTEQRASTIAGQNIANASTPGYTRQEVVRSSVPPNTWGVRITSTDRANDEIVRRRMEDQLGLSGFADRRAARLSQLEDVAIDGGDGGLLGQIDAFFGAFRELEATPDDPAQRREIIAAAESLAGSMQRMASDLDRTRDGLNQDIVGDIDQVNSFSADVARLNAAIKVAEAGGESANELRDQRDRALASLAELAGAYGIEDDDGDMTVVVNGIVLAQKNESYAVRAVAESDGTVRLEIPGTTRGDVTAQFSGGTIGGSLAARDGAVADSIAALDQLAFDFANAVNGVHQGFVGLDGAGGRDFFAAPATVDGAAINFRVDAVIASDASLIATATGPGTLPGDNAGVSAMNALESSLVASGGTQSLAEAARGIVSDLGTAVRAASAEETLQQGRLDALTAVREQISGVSIEEQLLALDRSQRAYQAASKVIQTVDEMLETVLSLKR